MQLPLSPENIMMAWDSGRPQKEQWRSLVGFLGIGYLCDSVIGK
jgi:hypothetical protein